MSIDIQVNKAFRCLYSTDNRFNVIYGGAGSGKSYSIAQMIVITSLQEKKEVTLVLRKVAATIRESVWNQVIQLISEYGFRIYCSINKTDRTIDFHNGSRILFMGLDDVEKLKSITGITRVWVEEASETTPDDIKQLDLRMRGGDGSEKMFLSFNPISKTHWLKSFFFDKERQDTFICKTTYKDNAFLSDKYREQIESYKDIDQYYYTVYALGEWGDIGNVIFSMYTIKHVPVNNSQVYYGVDFGFNHPSAIIGMQYVDGEVNVVQELCRSGLTNTDLIEEAKKILPHGATLVCDSAEPDRIEEFCRAGFNAIPCAKGEGSVRAGIDWLKSKQINIDESCTHIADEISGYKWLEDKDGNAIDKPIPFNDDCIAALRYAIEPIRLAMGKAVAVNNIVWR